MSLFHEGKASLKYLFGHVRGKAIVLLASFCYPLVKYQRQFVDSSKPPGEFLILNSIC